MNQRTRIKICGVSQEADIEAAVAAGADAVGFVFHRPSVRCLDLDRAARLARALPPFVTPVGLFVNAPRADIEAVVAEIPTLLLQFHGDETPADCALFRRPYLRAVRMTAELDLLDFARRFSEAQGLLLDAHVEGFGGGGKAFDWSLVPAGFPAESKRRLVLSGGLHAANVCAGI
ncbi:MAG TPA: phosphoribosylanthranilate isomerase, partial [Caldimonas sp.]